MSRPYIEGMVEALRQAGDQPRSTGMPARWSRPPEHDLAHPGRFTCAGRVVPGVEVRFRLPDGALGERAGAIEVRLPDMASGYLRRPVEQATNFVDGWYRSGDLGELDDEGYLHIHGRVVDCAEIDGRLVSPTALQDLLCPDPTSVTR